MAVPNVQSITPDDGQRIYRKHVKYQNKIWKLVRLLVIIVKLSVTCLHEPLHFDLVLTYTIYPSLLVHFDSLVPCSSLLISFPFCSKRLCFVLCPFPALGCLPWNSTKTFLPSYCFCFVLIYQLRGLLSFFFFLLSLCSLDSFLCFSLSCTC